MAPMSSPPNAKPRAPFEIKPRSVRLVEPDVVRAVALIGVVLMNYHGYLILRGGTAGESFPHRLFNTNSGPFTTRFAATFVLMAGVGVTLMTNFSRRSRIPRAISDDRWRLIRRGVLLYAFGYVFNWIWDGTILFFYGAMFVVAAFLFTLRMRWLVAVGTASAIAAAGLQWWRFERTKGGHDTSWLFASHDRSPRSLLFDTFVNGTHPLLPWLAFLCAGMMLGRMLPLRHEWKLIGAVAGVMIAIFTHLVSDAGSTTPLRAKLLATDPWNRGLLYTVGTFASSVAAFIIVGAIAQATRTAALTRALSAAGRTTLSIYVLHALVFDLVVDHWGWITPTGLDTASLFAAGFWVVAIAGAAAWQRHFGIGPLERVYRKFGG